SAMGHETHCSLSDCPADLRAPTPSAAAELLVPNADDLARLLRTLEQRMRNLQRQRLRQAMQRADRAALRLQALRPRARLDLLARRQADAVRRLRTAMQRRLEQRQARLQGLARSLSAISPLATVARGYSILQHPDGRVSRSAGDAASGDLLDARVSDGQLRLTVT